MCKIGVGGRRGMLSDWSLRWARSRAFASCGNKLSARAIAKASRSRSPPSDTASRHAWWTITARTELLYVEFKRQLSLANLNGNLFLCESVLASLVFALDRET